MLPGGKRISHVVDASIVRVRQNTLEHPRPFIHNLLLRYHACTDSIMNESNDVHAWDISMDRTDRHRI